MNVLRWFNQPKEPDRSNDQDYNADVDQIREEEYPMLQGTTYLDHAGTTLYARSLIEDFSKQMLANLYGNPHSASTSSQLSNRRIDDVRTRALRFFDADPDEFDLVFVANATAGIKLVVEALRECEGGFWYGYHADAHTSLVGVREEARAGHRCFRGDQEVEDWFENGAKDEAEDISESGVGLFAYPAQSNMNGRRLPLDWPGRMRRSIGRRRKIYTLLDAAAYVSTSPLDLGALTEAPDFTVLSFYKIFGFPDLGALIVRKDSASILAKKRFFGGGTVELVTCGKETWHMPKQNSIHERLEDGTLPIHSILALDSAFDLHTRLYGSMKYIARHTAYLARNLYDTLTDLRHWNGRPVCQTYTSPVSAYDDWRRQGPIIAFNFRDSRGNPISNAEVEKLASVRNIQIRSGGLCNPGGIAAALDLAPWEMKRNFSAGQRCGNDMDIMDGKATGVLRVSLGAMSNKADVNKFIAFIEEFFQEKVEPTNPPLSSPLCQKSASNSPRSSSYTIASLTVYPIKSCGGFSIPAQTPWHIRDEGLAWDREWCLIHSGTRQALSQKKYPQMSLIKPQIDLSAGVLRVQYQGAQPPSSPPARIATGSTTKEIIVPLSANPNVFIHSLDPGSKEPQSRVCGDAVSAQTYSSPEVSAFFSTILDTPCTLARFPSHAFPHGHFTSRPQQTRFSKLTSPLSPSSDRRLGDNSNPRLLLSNESPLLILSLSSLNALNSQIKRCNPGGKPAHASVFRANVVLEGRSEAAVPYAEDSWTSLSIIQQSSASTEKQTTTMPSLLLSSASSRAEDSSSSVDNDGVRLDILGGCRRCQMVCVDQSTGVKDEEPFVTLSKTRRGIGAGSGVGKGKGVYFGVHASLSSPLGAGTREDGEEGVLGMDRTGKGEVKLLRVGDEVRAFC